MIVVRCYLHCDLKQEYISFRSPAVCHLLAHLLRFYFFPWLSGSWVCCSSERSGSFGEKAIHKKKWIKTAVGCWKIYGSATHGSAWFSIAPCVLPHFSRALTSRKQTREKHSARCSMPCRNVPGHRLRCEPAHRHTNCPCWLLLILVSGSSGCHKQLFSCIGGHAADNTAKSCGSDTTRTFHLDCASGRVLLSCKVQCQAFRSCFYEIELVIEL